MRSEGRPISWGFRASITLLCGSMLLASCGDDATAAEQATEFWEAIESGDADAAIARVDPSSSASGAVNTFGRAATLERQFDWYEAVDWEWALEECVEADNGSAVCKATARNAWSEALAVEPVEGTFEMEFSEAGITGITDQGDEFVDRWGSLVFGVFADWVVANHPEDADVMFDFTVDVNPEILDLYRFNSDRFVEAQEA